MMGKSVDHVPKYGFAHIFVVLVTVFKKLFEMIDITKGSLFFSCQKV